MNPEAPLMPHETVSYPDLIKTAADLARNAHEGQSRKSGEPYFKHCEETALIIYKEWGLTDPVLIAAAYTHDVVEDTTVTLSELSQLLGPEVAFIVEGVSEFKSAQSRAGSPITDEEKKDNKKKTLKKVLSGSYIDIRVALTKLADRLHNMRSLDFMSEDKQKAKAEETLRVHAKLAESYGMWKVKTELEDLSFRFSEMEEYEKVKDEIVSDPRNSEMFIGNVQSTLEALLNENRMNAALDVRKGGYYELYKKRKRLALEGEATMDSFKNIDDVISFRVIMKNYADCFQFFNTIRDYFDSNIDYDKVDLYIGSNKRENGYSAIHLVVNTPLGPFEIALATEEDEDFNNNGILSVLKKGNDTESYKLKLVFTPAGDVVFLPKSATGIDFAYALNPQMGAQAIGLLVDGKRMPVSTNAQNASVVEVLVSEELRRAPSPEFLNYCLPKTAEIIASQLRMKERDSMIDKGKQITEKVLEPWGIFSITDLKKQLNEIISYFGCRTVDDFHYKMAITSQNSMELKRWLNEKGISKESLDLTSIRLTGKDKEGTLNRFTDIINKLGGNIVTSTAVAEKGVDSEYFVELVVKGLHSKGVDSDEVKSLLLENNRFSTCLVI